MTAVVNKIDVKLASMHERDDKDLALSRAGCVEMERFCTGKLHPFTVEKGWITLSGKVDFDHQRKAAEHAVRPLAGVRGVTIEITLEPRVSHKDVQSQIKRALHRHAEQEAENIHIEVLNGEVVLSGHVESPNEKGAIEAAALATAGVRKVKNYMIIGHA